MESIEKGIHNIDLHTKNSIEKHKELLAKTIYDTASKAKVSLQSFEKQCGRVFSDIDSIGLDEQQAFNPHTVIEFREGKSHQVLESWNKTYGLLPNRKVMGKYYVDKLNNELDENTSKKIYYIPERDHKSDHFNSNNSRVKDFRNNCSPNSYTLNSTSGIYNLCHNYHQISFIEQNGKVISKYLNTLNGENIIKRGESRDYIFDFDETITFEVDNYLNLFHKSSGLYLMFNKNPFLDASFYFAREYNQLPDQDYYQIFLSKRVIEFNLQFTQQNYQSVDNRSKLLEEINNIVPDNYQRIYKLFENFRKLSSYNKSEISSSIDEPLSGGEQSVDITDPKDRIIESFKLRLRETIKRCENSEQIVSEMTDEYNNKSVELQDLNSKIIILESKLKEQQLEYQEKLVGEIEKVKCDNFGLFKRLNEAEVFKAKSESLGLSITQLQKQLEIETLEKNKIKSLNTKLTDSIQEERTRNKTLKENNDGLFSQVNANKDAVDNFKIKFGELNKSIDEKSAECLKLAAMLQKQGDESSDVLNVALSDRISDLEDKNQILNEQKNSILQEKNKVEMNYNKIKMLLKDFNDL